MKFTTSNSIRNLEVQRSAFALDHTDNFETTSTHFKKIDNLKDINLKNGKHDFNILPTCKNKSSKKDQIKIECKLLDTLLENRLKPETRRRTISELFDKFSSLRQIIYASRRSMSAATENGAIAHDELQKAKRLAVTLAQVEIKDQPVLSNYDQLINYCRTFLAGETKEQFHAFFLNKANELTHSECLATGTIDHVAVYPRELFDRALEYSAASIILVHNHPSGTAKPSRTDIQMTRKLAMVGHCLGITLADHIIVSRSEIYSFRSQNDILSNSGINHP